MQNELAPKEVKRKGKRKQAACSFPLSLCGRDEPCSRELAGLLPEALSSLAWIFLHTLFTLSCFYLLCSFFSLLHFFFQKNFFFMLQGCKVVAGDI